MTLTEEARKFNSSLVPGFLAAAALSVLFAQRPSPCLAGPPFITDDPVPVDKGHGEIYFTGTTDWSRDGVSGALPSVEFDYGPFDNVEIEATPQMAYSRPDATGRMDYGSGDTELGVDYRFIQEDQFFPGCPQVAIYPLLELPTGDVHRGLGNGRAQEFIPIWMQKSWGPDNRQWTLYGGGGYEFNPGTGNENFGYFGGVLQKQITDNFALGLELFHFTPQANGESGHTGFNVGFTYDFSDSWHLLFSAGRDLSGDDRFINYTSVEFTY
jgi:hypothetical protein